MMAAKAKIDNLKENECALVEAQPGDMIEFIRGVYSHWAIYIGNNEVVHRWGENDGIGQSVGSWGNLTIIYGVQFDKAEICKSNISDVLTYGGKVRVNNYLDGKKKPLSAQIILERAEHAIGRKGYNLLYNNCEHFATDCRYGQATCRQIQTVVSSVATATFIIITTATVAYISSRSAHDEKERKIKEIPIKQ